MSKQLSISATLAVLSMAALALFTTFGKVAPEQHTQLAANAPVVTYEVAR